MPSLTAFAGLSPIDGPSFGLAFRSKFNSAKLGGPAPSPHLGDTCGDSWLVGVDSLFFLIDCRDGLVKTQLSLRVPPSLSLTDPDSLICDLSSGIANPSKLYVKFVTVIDYKCFIVWNNSCYSACGSLPSNLLTITAGLLSFCSNVLSVHPEKFASSLSFSWPKLGDI